MYVVVTGPPAAGKSTLAAALAVRHDLVEVFCRCDLDTMRSRYAQRTPTKGPGHFEDQRNEDELWPEQALRPLDGTWRVVEVDTATPVDLDALVSWFAGREQAS